MDKAEGYMGLARRAGTLLPGEKLCREAAGKGRLCLLVTAADAAERSVRHAHAMGAEGNFPTASLPRSKEELGRLLGCRSCAMAGFTDAGLAAAFAGAMAQENEEYKELQQLIVPRDEKAERVKAAGRKNKAAGKGGQKNGSNRNKI